MIKPSSQTPTHKKTHQLSFFDKLVSPVYIPLLFFYRQEPFHPNSTTDIPDKTHVLKTSLSSVLTKYYPLAGTIATDSLTVDCNDRGVLFLQARMSTKLSEFLEAPTDEAIREFFPDDLCYKDTTLSSPLTVQVTEFDCGGLALALCWSHMIVDMSSLCSFVNCWAALAVGRTEILDTPLEFVFGTLYPPVNLQEPMVIASPPMKCITKRLVFSGTSIAKLKSMVSNKVNNPTRVEVVLALLYGSAVSAARACSVRALKPTILSQAVNLRGRLASQAQSATSVGNFVSAFSMAPTSLDFDPNHLPQLVELMRKTKTEYFESCAMEFGGREEFCKFIAETFKEVRGVGEGMDVYIASSWCGYPLYDSDFGFGKPVWMTSAGSVVKDVIVLMDSRNRDGIEALVCLEEHEMAAFERDPRVLDFAEINPNPIP
ncbi:Acyltransferase Pun1 [Linum grandiflorum]